jgi:hypothetical protein
MMWCSCGSVGFSSHLVAVPLAGLWGPTTSRYPEEATTAREKAKRGAFVFGVGASQSSSRASPTKASPQQATSDLREQRLSQHYNMLQRSLASTTEQQQAAASAANDDAAADSMVCERRRSFELKLAEPRSSMGASWVGVARRASLPEEITVVQDDRTEREVCCMSSPLPLARPVYHSLAATDIFHATAALRGFFPQLCAITRATSAFHRKALTAASFGDTGPLGPTSALLPPQLRAADVRLRRARAAEAHPGAAAARAPLGRRLCAAGGLALARGVR